MVFEVVDRPLWAPPCSPFGRGPGSYVSRREPPCSDASKYTCTCQLPVWRCWAACSGSHNAAIQLDRGSRRCRMTPAVGALADVRTLRQCDGGLGFRVQGSACLSARSWRSGWRSWPTMASSCSPQRRASCWFGSWNAWRRRRRRQQPCCRRPSSRQRAGDQRVQCDGRQLGQAEGQVAAGVVPGASLLLLCTQLPDCAARWRLCAGLLRQRRRRCRRRMPSRAVLPQPAAAGQPAAGRRSAAALQAGWPPAAAATGVRRARAQRGGAPLRRRAAGVRGPGFWSCRWILELPRSWWSSTGTWGMSGMRWVASARGSWRAMAAPCRRRVLMLDGISRGISMDTSGSEVPACWMCRAQCCCQLNFASIGHR